MASRYISPWNHKDTNNRSRNRARQVPSSSFQITAVKKLKNHPDYKQCGENECSRRAAELTNKERIVSKFFSAISTGLAEMRIGERISEDSTQFSDLTAQEQVDARERARWRVEDAARLEVKLLLRHVQIPMASLTKFGAKILNLWYGPLHAALLINDTILLEWTTNSLVIPNDDYDPDDMNYPMATRVLHNTGSVEQPQDIRSEEIELIFAATSQKIETLNALVSVIAKYNGQFYYDAIRKNCQHFVVDALNEMGCENVPVFKAELGEYFKKLEAGRAGTDFEDHSKLDKYVNENILEADEQQRKTISTQHKEYLLCQYFEFHVREMTGQNVDEWQCSQGDACRMAELESCIQTETMLMHKFLKDS